jgi:hypothetical protein
MEDDDTSRRPALEPWLRDLGESSGVAFARASPRESEHGRGLFATSDGVDVGDVVLSVPKKLALVVQADRGLALPSDGSWPRVRAGVAAAAPDAGKTCEFVLARAIVDAVAGDGGAFWTQYAGVLPPPEKLAHPFLLSDAELASLQDDDLAAEGRNDAMRIAALMPDLTDAIEGGERGEHETAVGAWALAVVRSRAMLAGLNTYAVVPFLDLANHATIPSVDYRCEGVETRTNGIGIAPQEKDATTFELVALKPRKADEELRLAYTRGQLTSAAHFAQYGFAPPGGSPLDRIDLIGGDDGGGVVRASARLRAALKRATKAALTRCAGEEGGGEKHAGWVAAAASVSAAFGSGDGDGDGDGDGVGDGDAATVETLLARVGAIESGYATTLEDDERALDEINEAVGDARDERAGNILGLRAGKKRLARRVAELLRELRET